jgi:two-component system, sensor histidine kinase and response regulator
MPADNQVSILMVDDEPANLLALEAVLEPLQQRLVRAGSGREALRRVLEEDFAVILLDVRMPDINGIETAELIRSRRRTQATPIIFLTGLEKSAEMMFEGYSAGAVDYLTKPIVPAILRAKVEVFIELEQARLRLRDEVAERLRAATELSHLNALLERRNADLAAANAELDAFCAAVSHDLRTPLAHVEGFIELLQMSAREHLQPKELEYIGTILQSTGRMRQLITEFLRFARLDASDLALEPVDMGELAAQARDDLGTAGSDANTRWGIGALPAATGDANLLRQVWINLMSNALKYSRDSPQPQISIHGHVDGSDSVYCVEDNGIGFDPQGAGRLFEAFFRMHSGGAYEGVGIGLASVKRIVQRHGGRVWADGRQGEGACFFFSLPQPSMRAASQA